MGPDTIRRLVDRQAWALRRQGWAIAAFAAVALAMLLPASSPVGVVPWLGSGLLLGVMLRRPRPEAGYLLLPVLVVDAGTRLVAGWPPALAVALAACDTIEVLVAWHVSLRLLANDPRSGIDDAPAYRFPLVLAITALLAPVAGALSATMAMRWLQPALLAGSLREPALAWWMGHGLGLLALTPVVRAWDGQRLRRIGGARLRELAVFSLLVLASACAASLSPVALPMVLAVLILGACRFAPLENALLGLLATSAIIVAATLQPFPAALGSGIASSDAIDAGFLLALVSLVAQFVSTQIATKASESAAANENARLASERLRVVADHSPGLIAQVDGELRYRFANRNWLRMFGKSGAEIVGQPMETVPGDADDPRMNARVARVMAGQPQQFDMRMQDGGELRVRYEPDFAADGGVDGFYLVAEDVSWRGQAQRRFDALLSAADALLLLDAEGVVVQGNAAAAALFDVPQDDLPGMHAAELFTQASSAVVMEQLRSAGARQAASRQAQALNAVRAGEEIPVELRLTALPGDGRACFAAAVRSLGEQVRLARELQRSRSLAQVTLEAVGDAVVAVGADRRICSFNQVAEKLTGWPRAEAIGQPFTHVLRVVAKGSLQEMPSPVGQAMADECEIRLDSGSMLVRRDGIRLPIEAVAAPIHDAQGGIAGGAMVFHDVSETQAMARKMSHLAQHDYLTDLPNRVLLHDRLSQALVSCDRSTGGALLFVDLDFFKNINDTLGHQAGDKVLQEVSRRLVAEVRADDTVSRQGGDEFVLLLVRVADPSDVARIAEKLIQAVERPFFVEGQELRISASIGIALFPQDGRDIRTLMKQADTALYHAKEAGRGCYSYFTEVMSERAERRMRMEHDLRFALANDDLFLVYQPKVLVPEGRITGMEALVRWRRSDTGEVVMPEEFIPVAEETGMIVAVDEWVMREACRQNKEWQDAGLPALPVAVNVSMARFDPERLIASVRSALADTSMDPACLEIEFTESQMFSHIERAQQLISSLKEMGVQIAVDDFGTGYSSLGYLMQYQFDALKIDRSFVQGLPDDPKHAAIVQAMIAMANALQYRVVAEGVENVTQAHALTRYGCREMQGFLYRGPVPPDEFSGMLKKGRIALTRGCKRTVRA